jgi:hypothetical protein
MQWFDQIEGVIRGAVGDEIADSLRDRWADHERRNRVEVTLFGPYDSGKSSLLRRLLVEDSVPVPEWLTVSARRETWSTNEIDALGLTFTDTPGVAAGDSDHERVATETITLTDAMLVVLPPQLLTGDKETILPIIDGRFFAPSTGWVFPDGALRCVIGRMDEGGIDPVDNSTAFERFADGKRQELAELLEAAGAGAVPVTTVIADPYGLVGNDGETYTDVGAADGVAALQAELQALATRQTELRTAAHVRYLLHAGHRVAITLDRHIGVTERKEAELTRRRDDHLLVAREIESLVSAARAALRSAINEEASAIADQPPAEEAVEAALRERIETRVSAWNTVWDGQLVELAERLSERYEANSSRPMTAVIDELFQAPEPLQHDPAPGATRAWDLVDRVGPILEKGLRTSIQSSLGMTLEDAVAEIERLEALDPETRAQQLADKTSAFTASDFERFSGVVKGAAVAVSFAPIVVGVAREIFDIAQGDGDEAGLKRLEARREELRRAADAVADGVLERWREGPDQLIGAARDTSALLAKSIQGIAEDLQRQREGRERLVELLEAAPRPTA